MNAASYQALPLHPGPARHQDFHTYPEWRSRVAEPALVPWPMKSLGSAQSGLDVLPDGRLRCWIRHEVVKGVTPRMLAWWFSHLEGTAVLPDGRSIDRYRLWHPYDHVHASYHRRLPDGSVGPGAAIRLREYLGANRRWPVNIVTEIEKLDEEGFIHNPVIHGMRGLARMEYTFRAVPGGTLYENCLIVGPRHPWLRWLAPVFRAVAFPEGKGEAWLRHNIEEVGMFENFLPGLYERELGRRE
ncbi:MAG: hypothetical protein ABW051_08105 [Burkholderiaceae bacterium]